MGIILRLKQKKIISNGDPQICYSIQILFFPIQIHKALYMYLHTCHNNDKDNCKGNAGPIIPSFLNTLEEKIQYTDQVNKNLLIGCRSRNHQKHIARKLTWSSHPRNYVNSVAIFQYFHAPMPSSFCVLIHLHDRTNVNICVDTCT